MSFNISLQDKYEQEWNMIMESNNTDPNITKDRKKKVHSVYQVSKIDSDSDNDPEYVLSTDDELTSNVEISKGSFAKKYFVKGKVTKQILNNDTDNTISNGEDYNCKC
ncbi:hypothetical protein F8M41_019161 [Gigaspora margarita]|uniref:Uncharacterized protein n=1 Tax=Gigaspora margarita TaxID=4874 RepID=A0A8H4EKL7_GIGMA|nr:hypothetical protein F8M41_019161 [Gigaspora margarita]